MKNGDLGPIVYCSPRRRPEKVGCADTNITGAGVTAKKDTCPLVTGAPCS